MTDWRIALLVVAATGCGLVGGLFFAFSNFVMRALARLPAPHGAAAMRHINVTVLNPLFLSVFLGTGAVAVLVAVASLRGGGTDAAAATTGAVLYVVGSVGVTVRRNVPLNDRLAATTADDAGLRAWPEYVRSWTRWNHVRTVASLAAAALFAAAAAAAGRA